MSTVIEKNSRKVTLYRKPNFIMEAQLKTAPDFVSNAKQSIGSFWVNSNSKMIGSGLTFAEQKLLMPSIVDCEPEDRNFRTKVSEYFSAINTVVPYKKGLTLEIGLTEDNHAELSLTNLPIDVHQFITYRHALAHPQVGSNKEAADGDMLKTFYIFDPQAAEDTNVLVNQNKDRALELYLEAKLQPEKVDMLLTLLKLDPRKYTGKNAGQLKLDALKDKAIKDSKTFIDVYEAKNFNEVYVLMTAVNLGIVTKVGEYFVDKNSQETIGHTIEESVVWLKNKANSDKVVLLKQRMQEASAGVHIDSVIKASRGSAPESAGIATPPAEPAVLEEATK